jgi:hypothetical protein
MGVPADAPFIDQHAGIVAVEGLDPRPHKLSYGIRVSRRRVRVVGMEALHTAARSANPTLRLVTSGRWNLTVTILCIPAMSVRERLGKLRVALGPLRGFTHPARGLNP